MPDFDAAAIKGAIARVMVRHPGADTLRKLRKHVEECLGLERGSLGLTKSAKTMFSDLVKEALSSAADESSDSDAAAPAKRKRAAASSSKGVDSSSSASQTSESDSDAAAPPPPKRKRAPAKRKPKRAATCSRREVQLRKMAKAVATGPRVFKGLATLSAIEREDELARRLRDESVRFAEWTAKTPTNAEVAKARRARDRARELEDMDTANILSPGAGRGGRRRRGSAPAPSVPARSPPPKRKMVCRRDASGGESSSEEEFAF